MSDFHVEKKVKKVNLQAAVKHSLIVHKEGELDTFDYRVFIHGERKPEDRIDTISSSVSSLWHDIPLFPYPGANNDKVVNMICEIPKCTRKKYEIATNEQGNPIKQDIKKGKLREFKKGDVYFNYGCLPRTWEDPDEVHPDAMAKGDNDPVDVCEIGLRIMKVAEVRPVKVLGTLCLIDEGEADWKIVCIGMDDPWAASLNDVNDVEDLLPGTIDSIREWFRTYKLLDSEDSVPNRFSLDERCMPAAYGMGIVNHTHASWKELVTGEKDRLVDGVVHSYSHQKVDSNLVDDNAITVSKGALPESQEYCVDGDGSSSGAAPIKRKLSYPKLTLLEIEESASGPVEMSSPSSAKEDNTGLEI